MKLHQPMFKLLYFKNIRVFFFFSVVFFRPFVAAAVSYRLLIFSLSHKKRSSTFMRFRSPLPGAPPLYKCLSFFIVFSHRHRSFPILAYNVSRSSLHARSILHDSIILLLIQLLYHLAFEVTAGDVFSRLF